MPTGFSDKFSNIYELLSEKRAEVRGQDSQLKIKERRLERDKRKLDLEFENSRLDALGSVDTTAYETTLAKVEAERSEIDAWLTELNFAIRVISTAEAPHKRPVYKTTAYPCPTERKRSVTCRGDRPKRFLQRRSQERPRA